MKVLFLIDSLEGYGAERSIVQIALHLKKITPVFVHLYEGENLKPLLLNKSIKVYSLNLSLENRSKRTLSLMSSIIDEEKPQILHSTLYRSNLIARKLKKIYPELILVGSIVSNSYGKNRYGELTLLSKINLFRIQCIDRWTSQNVDFFISNSNAIMKTNCKALGIKEEKIQVIYRGRNFQEFIPSLEAIQAVKEEFHLQHNKIIFLNVSRLVKSKGQLDLLLSFKGLIDKHSENILIIAGEGKFRPQLEEEIKNLELQRNVFLLGYREDISSLLAFSDYFVFPTYYEGLPGALLEAIIAKKPSIVSDIPENRECFSEEGALFFPPGDIKALTLKMEKAIIMKNWKEKVNNSFSHAQKNFQILSISREYETLYQSLFEKKKH